jgi:hypothetical protein
MASAASAETPTSGASPGEAAIAFAVGIQPDCSWREIDNFFAAPVDEGYGIVSQIDSGGGLEDERGGPAYSSLEVASCIDETWLMVSFDTRDGAERLLAQMRQSQEVLADMRDDAEASGAHRVEAGTGLEGMTGFGLLRCACDIHYGTNFGQFGASQE